MNTLDQLLNDMQSLTSPEAQFAEKVAEAQVETQVDETAELRKIAADVYAQGEAFGRGFINALNEAALEKTAVTVTGMTPNTASVPENPAIQVSNGEVHEADTAQVEGVIKKLTLGGEAKLNPAGALHVNNQPVAATQPIAADEHPIAADVKTAAAQIIDALYEKYFA